MFLIQVSLSSKEQKPTPSVMNKREDFKEGYCSYLKEPKARCGARSGREQNRTGKSRVKVSACSLRVTWSLDSSFSGSISIFLCRQLPLPQHAWNPQSNAPQRLALHLSRDSWEPESHWFVVQIGCWIRVSLPSSHLYLGVEAGSMKIGSYIQNELV